MNESSKLRSLQTLKYFEGENCTEQFLKYLKKIKDWITTPNFTPALKNSDEIAIYSKATQCYLCHSKFSSKEGCKNFVHCHISSRYRGA